MLVAARFPVCIGVVPWPGRAGLWTVVVKRTYDVVPRGVARLAERQQSLRVESVDERGHLAHPSDFVLAKNLCDVVFVGDALVAGGPARLGVDPVRKLVEVPREMGPVRAPGDPSDPMFGEGWAAVHFDGDASQCAPVDLRRPCTPLPLEISYDLGPIRASTRIEGPAPQLVLLDRTGWSAPRMLVVRMDTILVDPAVGQIALLFRGRVEVPDGCDPLLVVEAQQPVRSFSPRAMEQWPQAEAVEPSLLRRLQALGAVADLEATASAARGPLRTKTVRMEIAPGGPKVAAPARAPSFGPPPPPRDIASSPPPSGPAPTPTLGGMMMVPLEVRSLPPPDDEPKTARGAQATLVDDHDDDPLVGTVQATAPPELRTRPLPFVPPPAAPRSAAPATRPLPSTSPPLRTPSRTLSGEEVAASQADETLVARGGALDVRALPFVSPRPVGWAAESAARDRAREPPQRVNDDVPRPRATPVEDDLGSGTVMTTVPAELRALPFVARPASVPPFVAAPPRIEPTFVPRDESTPHRASNLPTPWASAAAASPARAERGPTSLKEEGAAGPRHLGADEFSAIRAELWGRRATRREVLRKHGFTELGWRLAERRFMKNLAETATSEKLAAVLSHMHVEAERSPSAAAEPAERSVPRPE